MRHPLRRSAVIAPLALLVALAPASAAEGPRQASGKFEGRNWTFEPMGAYAFPSEVGMDDEPGIRVAVSNAAFLPEGIDIYHDRQHAIDTYFRDDETLVVYFDFSKSGAYKGMSYYFGSGDGCGFCYDGGVESTVKVANGRIRGKIKSPVKEGETVWEVEIDAPVASSDFGTALPAGGGEPGAAYAAYHTAIAAWDYEALRKFYTEKSLEKWDAEKEGIVGAYRKDHPDKSAKVVKGWSKGDSATLLVEGETGFDMRATSEVLMVKEKGTWRVKDELLQARLGE
jgi:hypothetical protein